MTFLDRARWEGKIFTTGGWVPGSGGEYDAVEPATGATLARVGAATAADVHKAAEAAAQAQRDWAALPYDRRAEVLRRAGHLFVEHEDEIHEWLVRESGAIRPFAGFQTRAVAAEECWEAAALAAHPYGELLRSNQPRLSMARRLPVGVVGVIAPFNAPIILAIRAIAPALALGNAVISSPTRAPRLRRRGVRADLRGGRAARRAVPHAARRRGRRCGGGGRPADPGDRVHRLHPRREDHRRAAAKRLKRVHLELGGNSALIVLDDVDLEKAVVGRRVRARSTTPGRSAWPPAATSSPTSIAADYAAALAEHADRLPVGDPAGGDVAHGPDHRRAASATRSTASSPPVRGRGRDAAPRAAPTRGCSTARRCCPTYR